MKQKEIVRHLEQCYNIKFYFDDDNNTYNRRDKEPVYFYVVAEKENEDGLIYFDEIYIFDNGMTTCFDDYVEEYEFEDLDCMINDIEKSIPDFCTIRKINFSENRINSIPNDVVALEDKIERLPYEYFERRIEMNNRGAKYWEGICAKDAD